MGRTTLAVAAACALLGAAGCGSSDSGAVAPATQPTSSARPHGPNPRQFLSWNAATRTAHLTLDAGFGSANGGFNFDGYGRGELLVTIPRGWRVTVLCDNRGGLRHSCAVVSGATATTPAFPGASTPQPVAGLSPGSQATFSFVLTRTGSFRFACLVPGHEQARMWDVLDVVAGGRPSISARAGF